MNKRGINTIIAVVLLILIAIIAIALLWFFFQPTLVGTNEQGFNTADCVKLNFEPEACGYFECDWGTGARNLFSEVYVKRGADSITSVSELTFLFSDENGGETLRKTNNSIRGLRLPVPSQTLKYTFIMGSEVNALVPKGVYVVPLLGGDNYVCPTQSSSQTCNLVETASIDGVSGDINGDGRKDFGDVQFFLNAFSARDPAVDFNEDGTWDIIDVGAYCIAYNSA